MRTRNFLVIFATFLLSCSTEQEQSNSNAGLEFYENGWIKSEIVSRTDSTERIAYYNRLDSGNIDSIYHYQVFQDTLLPFYQMIFNDPSTKDNLTIDESSENGYRLDIELRNARGDWIYLNFLNEEGKGIKTVHGSMDTNHDEPRTISFTDSIRTSNNIIIGDWWIWIKPQGKVGRQLERQIFIDLDDWKNEL